MGSIASGIFGLLSGDPAAEQEKQLQGLSGWQTPQGEKLTGAASDFDMAILSGDPTKISQVLSPEISAISSGANQQRLQAAEFGGRTGGTAAQMQQVDDNARANIFNLIGGLQQGAASGAANLGTNLMSQASGNINDVAGLKTAQQQRESADIGGIAQGVAAIAAAPFTGGASMGFGDLSWPGGKSSDIQDGV